jgi:hypothetical protein
VSLLSYQVAGGLSIQLSGGDGNDRIIGDDIITLPEDVIVDSQVDSASPPAIRYVLAGGAGDDELTLRLNLAAALHEFFAALVDGGDGFDACRVRRGLPNVRVVNCEDNDRRTS